MAAIRVRACTIKLAALAAASSKKRARPKPGSKSVMVGCLQEDNAEAERLWLTSG
jgi:hypothetical protein